MSAIQPQEELRPGILSSFASSIINVLQPLVSRHEDVPQSDIHTQEPDSVGSPPAPNNPATGRELSTLSESPSPTKDSRPSRLIPGRWDSVDYTDMAVVGREAGGGRQLQVPTADHVTATQNRLNHGVPESPQQTEESSDNNPVNHDITIAFPQPRAPPRLEASVQPHVSAQPYLVPNSVTFATGPLSRGPSPLPQIVEKNPGNNFGKLGKSTTNIPPWLNSPQTALLEAPVISGNNRSQDHLPTPSINAAPAQPPEKKRFSHFLDSTKTRFKSPSPSPTTSRFDSPSATPPGRLRAAVASQKSDTILDAVDPKIEYFQNVELHSSTTWDVIWAELMPLPAFNQILNYLNRVFGAVDNIKTYRGQWRRLRGNCVVASRLLFHQYERYQAEPERFKLLDKVCNDLGLVIAEISIDAQKWSQKNKVEAFVCYDMMEKTLGIHFQALGDVIQAMVSTSQVLNETWTSDIAVHQKEEREQIEMIHTLLKEQNASLAQLAQAIQSKDNLIARLIGENETTIGRFLGQQMDQFKQARGDAEDIDKLIQLIVQITGVQLPTEVFQTETCTNISGVEPMHGDSSTVYKARLARGQVVAKKVFYLNKYTEGDVKTYAMKMTRDAKLWRVFDSEYTLKCLGIGMERTNDTQFKLYMLSPWMENMDALKYLKDRRNEIDPRNILRIVADAALGLVEIHGKKSVHSNMRAQNVFVRANGRGILGGFGLTKALKNHATGRLPSVEQTGQSLPYRWMAPECHKFGPGRPDVTVANDVWGWAMTALEIVTGAQPIRQIQGDMALPCAKKEEFDIAKQRKQYPEWEKYAHKPDLLWSLLSKCWNLDETKRPDMQTVSNEIENIIAQP